jgi:AbrB family looped-hinge helix DNA binding protein
MGIVVKVDEKGRVVIPKSLREMAELGEGRYVTVTAREKVVIIEPLEPAADKYLGAFKIARWPEDLDEFVVEAVKKWWISQRM